MAKYIKIADRKPAEGGAVGGGQVDEVRGPIKDMLAGGSEEDFKDSLPEQTSSDGEGSLEPPAARKKRRSKAEILAAKGEGTPAMVDKRLERAKQKQTGLGAAGLVSAGFTVSGKPLNDQEDEDIGDQFYLISNKLGGNSDSWFFIIFYTVALIAKLIMVRTQLGEEVQAWMKEMFKPKERKGAEQQKQTSE